MIFAEISNTGAIFILFGILSIAGAIIHYIRMGRLARKIDKTAEEINKRSKSSKKE